MQQLCVTGRIPQRHPKHRQSRSGRRKKAARKGTGCVSPLTGDILEKATLWDRWLVGGCWGRPGGGLPPHWFFWLTGHPVGRWGGGGRRGPAGGGAADPDWGGTHTVRGVGQNPRNVRLTRFVLLCLSDQSTDLLHLTLQKKKVNQMAWGTSTPRS